MFYPLNYFNRFNPNPFFPPLLSYFMMVGFFGTMLGSQTSCVPYSLDDLTQQDFEYGTVYMPNDYPEVMQKQIVLMHNQAYEHDLSIFAIQYQFPIQSYLVNNPSIATRKVETSVAFSESQTIWIYADHHIKKDSSGAYYFIQNYYNDDGSPGEGYRTFSLLEVLQHEMGHVLTYAAFGGTDLIFLSEGVAEWAASSKAYKTYYEIYLDLHYYVNYGMYDDVVAINGSGISPSDIGQFVVTDRAETDGMDAKETMEDYLPPLQNLMTLNSNEFYGDFGIRTYYRYQLAGSFCGYLWHTYGKDAFVYFYNHANDPPIDSIFKETFGLSIAECEINWKISIEPVP